MTRVPILTGAGPLLQRHDLILSDVWGVVHDGIRAYPAAGAALARFRSGGGTVVLVSNAPLPGTAVAELLDDKGVRRDAWDAIVSSGDLAIAHIEVEGYRRVHRLGPARDAPLFKRVPGKEATIETADALLCSGLIDDSTEKPEQYLDVLQEVHARGLPFVCANPDLAVHVGEDLLPCAGALAALYEEMGGSVYWAGKPYPVAFGTAHRQGERLRGAEVPKARILVIGDALRTDIAGAMTYGVSSLLVAGGLHREAILRSGQVDGDRLEDLLAIGGPRPSAAIATLAW